MKQEKLTKEEFCKIYHEGWKVGFYFKSHSEVSCPYEFETEAYTAWWAGFNDIF